MDHPDDVLKLDNQICFALYVCSKEIIRKYKPFLDPLGLTYTGYIAMLALWERDDVTVKELGERLSLDSGTLTPLLKKLEAAGYVDRYRSSADERNVLVKLTNKGADLKAQAVSIPQNLLCAIYQDKQIDEKSAGNLLDMLHNLQQDLEV